MRMLPFLALAAVNLLISFGRGVAVAYEVIAEIPSSMTVVVHAITEFAMTPFRLDYGAVHDFIDRYVLSAFRLIGMLKPEYEESLETDGQSHLMLLQRVTSRC